MVTAVVVYQLIAVSYEHHVSIPSLGSDIPNSLNLTSSHSVHEVVSIRIASDLVEATHKREADGEDKEYDFATDDDTETGNFVETKKGIESHNKFNTEKDSILDESSTMRQVRSTDKTNAIKPQPTIVQPIIVEQVKKSYQNYTASTPSTETIRHTFMKNSWKRPTSISDMTVLWRQTSGSASNSMVWFQI